MMQSFGNIKDTTLKEAIEKPGFKDLWFICKDKIDVCKDCEFRHMCTDCRAYIKDPENIYSQPAKCPYNPYIAKWRGEEGYVTVEECGTYSKEKGFVVREFNNGDDFISNFLVFLDEQTQNVNNESNDTRYKLFTNFNENLWQSDLNATWLPALTELRKISDAQRKDLDTKVEKWHASIMPGATWLTYILIVLGVLLVAIIGVWLFRKGPKTAQKV